MNNFVHFWNYRRSCCYRSFVKAVHFFLWCYGVNFVYVISYICTHKTKEELSNNQNCQKSIPKPYYKRKQRPRIITSLKGSIEALKNSTRTIQRNLNIVPLRQKYRLFKRKFVCFRRKTFIWCVVCVKK